MIFAASICIVFLTIFCFVSLAMQCEFSSFGIIGDTLHWAFITDESAPNHRALQAKDVVMLQSSPT